MDFALGFLLGAMSALSGFIFALGILPPIINHHQHFYPPLYPPPPQGPQPPRKKERLDGDEWKDA